jgi:hypothetical protein
MMESIAMVEMAVKLGRDPFMSPLYVPDPFMSPIGEFLCRRQTYLFDVKPRGRQ